jgi:hypothetical protein
MDLLVLFSVIVAQALAGLFVWAEYQLCDTPNRP